MELAMVFHDAWAQPVVSAPPRRTRITENLRLLSFLRNEYAGERELISALTATREDELDTIQDKKILFRTTFQCQIVASPSTSQENSPSTIVWHPPSKSNEVHCSICLEGYTSGQLVCVSKKPECNHIFHKDCMEGWMMTSPCCPLCRVDLMTSRTYVDRKKG